MILLSLLTAFADPTAEEPAATEAPAGPVTYTLDAKASFLGVLVQYDRDALVKGHDHVVAASDFDGTVTWGPDLAACKVEIAFPVSALAVDPGSSRSRLGLEGSTSDGDKSTIKKNLSGKHQIDADNHPQISFRSTGCEPKGEKVAVSGTLSLHGVDAPVTALMSVSADASGFSAKGGFQAGHATWGMDPFTALLGSLRNDEGLAFHIDVKGTPQ